MHTYTHADIHAHIYVYIDIDTDIYIYISAYTCELLAGETLGNNTKVWGLGHRHAFVVQPADMGLKLKILS